MVKNSSENNIWQWPDHEFLCTQLDQEQQIIFDILQSVLTGVKNKEILEPGCGTSKISFHLFTKGANITLCDLSANAVSGSRLRFSGDQQPKIIQANLLSLPFKSNAFDLVWNSGVMEHFWDDAIIRGLNEMARVSKRYVAVFVPFKNCFPYNLAKIISEANGTWKWGVERPKRSLRVEFEKAGLDVIDEFDFGQRTNIPLSYLNLLPAYIAAELEKDYLVRSHYYCGVSLATIGVKKN
jgi:ubiquinone/menaquinone biosynthesis C-methylase UbiE